MSSILCVVLEIQNSGHDMAYHSTVCCFQVKFKSFIFCKMLVFYLEYSFLLIFISKAPIQQGT